MRLRQVCPAGNGGVALVGMRVTLAEVQVVPVNTWTQVHLDDIDYDDYSGGSFNIATHQWTCPADGTYSLALSGGFLDILPNGCVLAVLMKKDGVLFGPYVRFCAGCADWIRVAAADIQKIEAGAVYDMWIRYSLGVNLRLQNLVDYTDYLAIHQLSVGG